MPLTPLQASIAELLAANRTPDSYLAGGVAMHIEPNSKRRSDDLDYFHDSEERVATAFAQDEALLSREGYLVEVLLRQPGFVRALVRKNDGETKVEWAHDSAWRFLPTVRSARAGFQLNAIDLAVNKLLALVGRDEPRDYLDIHEAMRVLPLGALCSQPSTTPSASSRPAILRRSGASTTPGPKRHSYSRNPARTWSRITAGRAA